MWADPIIVRAVCACMTRERGAHCKSRITRPEVDVPRPIFVSGPYRLLVRACM